MLNRNCLSACLLVSCCVFPVSAQQVAPSNRSDVVVPPLVSFNGVLSDLNGQPLTDVTGVTFLLYKDEHGGEPLWMETQNVQPDKTGHYTVMLGSKTSTGLAAELFVAGEARYLEVQPEGQLAQPRILLLSVPYALKAADAQTVGGLPATAFVLAVPGNANATSREIPSAPLPLGQGPGPVMSAGGTGNKLAKFDAAGDVTNSQIYDNGTNVGIGNTTPAHKLDVSGSAIIRGQLSIPATGTATATAGKNSQPVSWITSAFNSGTAKAVNQSFLWQAEPAGNNTATPSGTMNLLFSAATAAPAETGLKITSNGRITATGITFGDGTSQTSAVAQGPQGPTGPQGPQGPPGPAVCGTSLEAVNPTHDYDGPELNDELTVSGAWTSTGWTGTYPIFTHIPGNTSPLTNSFTVLPQDGYRISFTLSGITAGKVVVTMGGQTFCTQACTVSSYGTNGTYTSYVYVWGNTNSFAITPTTDFNGTVSQVSVIGMATGTVHPTQSILDSTGAITSQKYAPLATLGDEFDGIGAGSHNISGYGNLFEGFQAGYGNLVGYKNVFLGYQAGYSGGTAIGSTFVGYQAGYSANGYNYNSALGYQACYSTTSGNGNSCFGQWAGYGNTTGNSNIFLGRNAGRYLSNGSTANATASYSLYIGSDNQASAAGNTYEVVVGVGATGHGSHTATFGDTNQAAAVIEGGFGASRPAIITVGDPAGTGASAACVTAHVCSAANGTIALTTGVAPTAGLMLTISPAVAHANSPDCLAHIVLSASPYTNVNDYSFSYTTGWQLNVGTPLAESTSYTITYSCLGY